ncbi:hypothetical protein EDD28_0058 [Salana multivorans]|uniref:DUF3553 domain-containing protein n=1 Tax=Salana multivorans TaxID=120377 RepID=A0A3N2D6Y3_9MICO|nr:hypothetical protein [Salana multivorans]ROR95505.1 hypothetical protein EDD28_0058 [Salana multivorans]
MSDIEVVAGDKVRIKGKRGWGRVISHHKHLSAWLVDHGGRRLAYTYDRLAPLR